jgi:hypothetical protein
VQRWTLAVARSTVGRECLPLDSQCSATTGHCRALDVQARRHDRRVSRVDAPLLRSGGRVSVRDCPVSGADRSLSNTRR